MTNENDGVVIRDLKEFQNLIRKWVRRYHEKPTSMSDEQWMAQALLVDLAEIPLEEHQEFSNVLMKQVSSISAAKIRAQEADEQGMDRKEWLYRELQGAASGLQVHEFGEYLSGVDATIEQCNLDWKKVFITNQGEINQNPHLHGYIFEQDQANSFNMDAALANKDIRAEVLRPEPGQTYAKDSPDIRLSDGTEYQAKAGHDQLASELAIENGNYEGQTPLVPKSQAQEGKSVDHIEVGGAKSKPSSHDDLKKRQQEAQEKGELPEHSWSDYSNRELAFNIGKQAAVSATFAAASGALFSVAGQLWENGEIESEPVAQAAVEGGARAGAVTAVSGAIKVALENNIIRFPWEEAGKVLVSTGVIKRIPIAQTTVISAIASTAIETACLGYKVAKGEMEPGEALQELERNACATVVGLEGAALGAAKGALVGGAFGPIGAAIGGFVSGIVGYMAGSTVGKMVATGVQKVRDVAVVGMEKAWEGVKAVGRGIKNIASSAWDGLCSILS